MYSYRFAAIQKHGMREILTRQPIEIAFVRCSLSRHCSDAREAQKVKIRKVSEFVILRKDLDFYLFVINLCGGTSQEQGCRLPIARNTKTKEYIIGYTRCLNLPIFHAPVKRIAYKNESRILNSHHICWEQRFIQ